MHSVQPRNFLLPHSELSLLAPQPFRNQSLLLWKRAGKFALLKVNHYSSLPQTSDNVDASLLLFPMPMVRPHLQRVHAQPENDLANSWVNFLSDDFSGCALGFPDFGISLRRELWAKTHNFHLPNIVFNRLYKPDHHEQQVLTDLEGLHLIGGGYLLSSDACNYSGLGLPQLSKSQGTDSRVQSYDRAYSRAQRSVRIIIVYK